MRTVSILVVIALLAAGALVLTGCESEADAPVDVGVPGDASVTMTGSTFQPSSVTIPAGYSVTWTNSDSLVHTVDGEGFSSGDIAPGAVFTQTFDTPGVYDYQCTIHPQMTGTVVVE